jgi:hypothetical protein
MVSGRGRTAGRHPVWWHERDYATPGYYGLDLAPIDYTSTDRRDYQKELQGAMHALVLAVSVKAPATTPWDTGEKDDRGYSIGWPHALNEPGRNSGDFRELRLMAPAVREAINRIDAVVRAAIQATYWYGKAQGRDVLGGLAKGEITLNDFDDALLTREQREKRRRA